MQQGHARGIDSATVREHKPVWMVIRLCWHSEKSDVQQQIVEADIHQAAPGKGRVEDVRQFALTEQVVAFGVLAVVGGHEADAAQLRQALPQETVVGQIGGRRRLKEQQPLPLRQVEQGLRVLRPCRRASRRGRAYRPPGLAGPARRGGCLAPPDRRS